MTIENLPSLFEKSTTARAELFDAHHQAAFRLFNGFTEGCPALVADLYATSIVLHNYADHPEEGRPIIEAALQFYQSRLPWIRSIVLKTRNGITAQEKNGVLLFGAQATSRTREHSVWYAIDLLMNRDSSLYLDTRNLRQWALQNLRGKTVLNTFAYTGSLGVAAHAGGAKRVMHLDLSRKFLNIAKTSYTLNGFPIRKRDFQTGDFWPLINRFKREGERFDCVFLDPPFFATTPKGVVDLTQNYAKLINKVRPLINDNGYLIAINNALFLSGAAYLKTLESLCDDHYLKIEELIPVPADFTGYDQTQSMTPITDPAPFNHSTKIAVLRVRRKS